MERDYDIYSDYKKDLIEDKRNVSKDYDVFKLPEDVFTKGREKNRYTVKKSGFIVGSYVRKPN